MKAALAYILVFFLALTPIASEINSLLVFDDMPCSGHLKADVELVGEDNMLDDNASCCMNEMSHISLVDCCEGDCSNCEISMSANYAVINNSVLISSPSVRQVHTKLRTTLPDTPLTGFYIPPIS